MFCLSEYYKKDSLKSKISKDGFGFPEDLLSKFKMRIRKPVIVKKPNDLVEATVSDVSSSSRKITSSLLSVKPVLFYLPQKIISNPPPSRSLSVTICSIEKPSQNFHLKSGLGKKNGGSRNLTHSYEGIGKEKPSINRIPSFKFNPTNLSRIHLQSDKKQPPKQDLGIPSSKILVQIPSVNSNDLENSISSKNLMDSLLIEEERFIPRPSLSPDTQQLNVKKFDLKSLLYQKNEETPTKTGYNEEMNLIMRSTSKRVSMKNIKYRDENPGQISKDPPLEKKIYSILSPKPKFSPVIRNRQRVSISRLESNINSKKVRFSPNTSVLYFKK